MSVPWYSRSGTAMVLTSEVFLSWMMDWFMNGGTMRRTACGSTTCRITCAPAQAQGAGRVPLTRLDGHDAAAEDLGVERAGVERQHHYRRHRPAGIWMPRITGRA